MLTGENILFWPKRGRPARFKYKYIALITVLTASTTIFASSETNTYGMPHQRDAAPVTNGADKTYIDRDTIVENFGAREAPYEGFLTFPTAILPMGYKEVSHHYTKSEYLISFANHSGTNSFRIDVVESAEAQFFEPSRYDLVKSFTFRGQNGSVFYYLDHLTRRPTLVLYWYNPPRQRLSISAEIDPTAPFSPANLVDVLKAMPTAVGVPALLYPSP